MPRVPEYSSLQVARRPLPGVEVASPASSRMASGRAEQARVFGQGLTSFGQALTAVATDMQVRENVAAVSQAEFNLTKEQIEFETGAMNQQGWNAGGLVKTAEDWWAQAQERHAKSLANEAQRTAFQKMFQERQLSSMSRLSRHQAAEIRQATNNTLAASIANESRLAALHAMTPEGVEDSLVSVQRKIAALGKLNGWSQEEYQKHLSDAVSGVHGHVLERQLATDPTAAFAYFEKHKDQITDPQVRLGWEKKIGAMVSDYRADSTAREVYQANPSSLTQALGELDKRYEGSIDVGEARRARDMVKMLFAEKEHSDRTVQQRIVEDQAAAHGELLDFLSRGNPLDKAPKELMDRLPPKVRYETITGLAQDRAEADWNYTAAKAEATLAPDRFAKRNLLEEKWFPRLQVKEQQDLLERWKEAKGVSASDSDAARSVRDVIQMGAASLGIQMDQAEKKGAAGDSARAFLGRVYAEVDAFQRTKGRKISPAETDDIVKRLGVSVLMEKNLLLPDKESRAWQVSIPGVPVDVIDEIADDLSRAGVPVTQDAIRDRYNQLVRQGAFK